MTTFETTISAIINEGSNEHGVEVFEEACRLANAAPETAAERDRLREINAELLAIVERAAQADDLNISNHSGPWLQSLAAAARAAIAKHQ